jgi:hypothetical protein
MQFLEISWASWDLVRFWDFSKNFGIFDEVYVDFQSNLPLGLKHVHI